MKETIEIIISALTLGATIFLGYIGHTLTKSYSERSDKISNDALFHSLFRDFNTRYGELNSYLKELQKKSEITAYSLEDLKKDSQLYDKSIDYLNICAEEYYWFKQGRLDSTVWFSWKSGMDTWYKEIPVLQELWLEEIAMDGYKSYYLQKDDNLFDRVS